MQVFFSSHLSTYLLAGLVVTLSTTGIGALPVATTEAVTLYRRNEGLTHPGPTDHSFLFHATSPMHAESVKTPKLSATEWIGDLHCNGPLSDGTPGGDSEGGFYMSDSAMAAAQYVCWGDPKLGTSPDLTEKQRVAHVLMFEWKPGSEIRGRVATKEDQASDDTIKLCINQDILSGPMSFPTDVSNGLTKDFWQYAIVRQRAVDSYLKYQKTIKIHCSYVPQGTALTRTIYANTQYTGPNAEFDAIMLNKETSVSPPSSPKSAGKSSKIPGTGSPKLPGRPGVKTPPRPSGKTTASAKRPSSPGKNGKKTPAPPPGKKRPALASKGSVKKSGPRKAPSAKPRKR